MKWTIPAAVTLCGFVLLLGCGGGMYGVDGPAAQAAPQRLYSADFGGSGKIRSYLLPLTSSATPSSSFDGPGTVSVAVDASGNLVSADNGLGLSYYPSPLSNTSTPSAAFQNGGSTGNSQIAFSPSGNLFVTSQSGSVQVFTPPFSNSSVPAGQVSDPNLSMVFGIAFDASGNLYLSGLDQVDVLPQEGTGAPVVKMAYPSLSEVRDIAVDGKHLFAAAPGTGGSGELLIYDLPISGSSVPAAVITHGIDNPAGVAVDAAGQVYVSNMGDSTLSVFAPPFSAGSVPMVQCPVASASLFGLSIGK